MKYLTLSALLPALLAACGEDARQDASADANPSAPDAATLSCAERMPLTIGQCIDGATGEPCLDFTSDERQFLPIAEQSIVQPILGLQGSSMFVLAVRGSGITPGENETAPLVELRVTHGEDMVGGFASRPVLIDAPSPSSDMIAPQLYTVAFFAEDIVGQVVDVIAEVEDQTGQKWCAEDSFEVGELIDAPALPI